MKRLVTKAEMGFVMRDEGVSLRRRQFICGCCALVGAAIVGGVSGKALAADPPYKTTILQDVSVSGQDGLHSVTASVEFPAGTATPNHTHPGDEYAVVVEGQITVKSNGQPDRLVEAGQSYFNPRGSIHAAHNNGTVPAKVVIVLVVDKGAPLLTVASPA